MNECMRKMVEIKRQPDFSLMEGPSGRLKAACGNIVTARGFSLMEVLFAVVVLAMGLVFVASQFPLGIINTAKVADATLNTIDAHNTEVMINLQLEGTITRGGYPSVAMDFRNDFVHPLVKPNVMCEPDSSGKTVLWLDDPEGYGTYLKSGVDFPSTDPCWPFWSQITLKDPFNPTTIIHPYQDYTIDYIGDIGNMVSPPVDSTDRAVREKVPDIDLYYQLENAKYQASNYFTQWLQMRVAKVEPAIFEVAMERPYSWCALYRCLDPATNPADFKIPRQFVYYIFTLRNHNKNARYAIQEQTVFGTPTPSTYDTDRKFPVPWRIDLDPGNPMLPGYDRFRLFDHTLSMPVADQIANILRKGSILVDALPSPAFPNDPVGNVYEVTELFQDNIGKWWIRLNRPINDYDPMASFWVIPPAIERDGGNYTFSDAQPVVNVTQKVVRF